MDPATTVLFAQAARRLSATASSLGLSAPGFRCPPRVTGIDRSLRRRPDGSATVAVRVRGRASAAVLADMVDGVVAANALAGTEAATVRRALWASVADTDVTDIGARVA